MSIDNSAEEKKSTNDSYKTPVQFVNWIRGLLDLRAELKDDKTVLDKIEHVVKNIVK